MKLLNKFISKEFISIFLIFFFDRLTKLYVIIKTENNLDQYLFRSKYLNFQLVWNEGIAFGLLSFNDTFIYNIITLLILVIIVYLIKMLLNSRKIEKIAFILVIGGAFGNFIDRLIYKSVPDFIDFHYDNFHWFIFNVADIFITLGIIILIINQVFYEKKN